jgi:hypothetical protein
LTIRLCLQPGSLIRHIKDLRRDEDLNRAKYSTAHDRSAFLLDVTRRCGESAVASLTSPFGGLLSQRLGREVTVRVEHSLNLLRIPRR